jgi:hypothetical protein
LPREFSGIKKGGEAWERSSNPLSLLIAGLGFEPRTFELKAKLDATGEKLGPKQVVGFEGVLLIFYPYFFFFKGQF